MAARILKTERDVEDWCRFLRAQKLPMTVTRVAGAIRSIPQNNTIALWYTEIAAQRGDSTFEEVRAECKLRFGVPILRRDDPAFCAQYDEMIRPFDYEQKLRLMEVTQWPVTSRMTTKQAAEYQDALWREFTGQGFVLTNPDAQGRDETGKAA